MKNNTYKILVLSDLKGSVDKLLINSVSLANMLNARIDFFHAKKPTDIVEKDNQLSAMRTINKDRLDTGKQIKSILKPIESSHNMEISSNFAYGNIKSEILKHIKKSKPDMIVLGKKTPSALRLIGENITEAVLKNYEGHIFVSSNDRFLEPKKELNLGVMESVEQSFNMTFAEDLLKHTKKPLKTFKIASKTALENTKSVSNSDVVEYVFENNDSSVNSLSKYLQKSNVNLFCLNRNEENSQNVEIKLKNVISKLGVPVLLSSAN